MEENGTVDELLDRFTMEMSRFKQYVFNIENQNQHYHELKEHISSNEVLIHVDFRKTTNVNWLEKYRACTMVRPRVK